ncbi:hypothetical protein GCM10009844_12530 [Nocardioides koreensis]|uniref:Uncharacterized protein n=1 Tax=Nocardioides koreensis TaxID=433651 RepID=A0ABN2ZGE3_9ACTN
MAGRSSRAARRSVAVPEDVRSSASGCMAEMVPELGAAQSACGSPRVAVVPSYGAPRLVAAVCGLAGRLRLRYRQLRERIAGGCGRLPAFGWRGIARPDL